MILCTFVCITLDNKALSNRCVYFLVSCFRNLKPPTIWGRASLITREMNAAQKIAEIRFFHVSCFFYKHTSHAPNPPNSSNSSGDSKIEKIRPETNTLANESTLDLHIPAGRCGERLAKKYTDSSSSSKEKESESFLSTHIYLAVLFFVASPAHLLATVVSQRTSCDNRVAAAASRVTII